VSSRIRARARPAAPGARHHHTPDAHRCGLPRDCQDASPPPLLARLHDVSCGNACQAPSRDRAGAPYHGSALPAELRGRGLGG
jgi:hypothetical protein